MIVTVSEKLGLPFLHWTGTLGSQQHTESTLPMDTAPLHNFRLQISQFFRQMHPNLFWREKKNPTHHKALLDNVHLQVFFRLPVLDHLLSHISNTCASREIAGLANQNLKVPKNPQNYTSSRSSSH